MTTKAKQPLQKLVLEPAHQTPTVAHKNKFSQMAFGLMALALGFVFCAAPIVRRLSVELVNDDHASVSAAQDHWLAAVVAGSNHWPSTARSDHWSSVEIASNHWPSIARTSDHWSPAEIASNHWPSIARTGDQSSALAV